MVKEVIPAVLTTDRCPLACSDWPYPIWVFYQEPPGLSASLDDRIVTVPDEVAELVGAQILPDVFHRVQFGRVGRQFQQRDVVWQMELLASLMPASAVAEQQAMGARGDLGADFLEMLVHALGVGRGHDDGGAHTTGGADRTIEIDGVMAVIAQHERARSNRRPDIGVRALLADTGFVLKPDFDRLFSHGGAGEQRVLYQADEDGVDGPQRHQPCHSTGRNNLS